MKFSILIAVASVFTIYGCGKQGDAPTAAAPTPAVKAEDAKQPAVPPTPATSLPAPKNSKDAEAQLPTPGQANDHSNPAFKRGGVPDKNK